jgi:hypothetical protein
LADTDHERARKYADMLPWESSYQSDDTLNLARCYLESEKHHREACDHVEKLTTEWQARFLELRQRVEGLSEHDKALAEVDKFRHALRLVVKLMGPTVDADGDMGVTCDSRAAIVACLALGDDRITTLDPYAWGEEVAEARALFGAPSEPAEQAEAVARNICRIAGIEYEVAQHLAAKPISLSEAQREWARLVAESLTPDEVAQSARTRDLQAMAALRAWPGDIQVERLPPGDWHVRAIDPDVLRSADDENPDWDIDEVYEDPADAIVSALAHPSSAEPTFKPREGWRKES